MSQMAFSGIPLPSFPLFCEGFLGARLIAVLNSTPPSEKNSFFQAHERNFILLLRLSNKYEPSNLVASLIALKSLSSIYSSTKNMGLIRNHNSHDKRKNL